MSSVFHIGIGEKRLLRFGPEIFHTNGVENQEAQNPEIKESKEKPRDTNKFAEEKALEHQKKAQKDLERTEQHLKDGDLAANAFAELATGLQAPDAKTSVSPEKRTAVEQKTETNVEIAQVEARREEQLITPESTDAGRGNTAGNQVI